MSTQQINLLAQVNMLMVRRGIALNKLARAYMNGVKSSSPELVQLQTFARAARDRAQFLLAQLG